jgi:glutamine amidotransferase-like uncharacterized protein
MRALPLVVSLLLCAIRLPGAPPVRIALYGDRGANSSSIEAAEHALRTTPDFTVTRLAAETIRSGGLKEFDVVVFPGGVAHTVSDALGENGRENVRAFVSSGGGYVGICSGAYLACSGFRWGLGILRARTISPLWRRGTGMVELGPVSGLTRWFEGLPETLPVRYANGPILEPDTGRALPPYEVVAFYRSELAENGTPQGAMTGSPAMVRTRYGRGAVFVSSPHPEKTPGMEPMVCRMVRDTARPPAPRDAASLWELLEGMEVERLWKPGVIVDWLTGLPTGRTVKPGDTAKHTHCSQFVAAACQRAGVYILRPPEHSATGLANAQFEWLASGAAEGWQRLDSATAAQSAANTGRVVVAVVRNPDASRPGHIALVRPGSKSAVELEAEGPDVMQAGARNRQSVPLRQGFSNHLEHITGLAFFAHDLP